MNFYQILGVERNCDIKSIHHAFRELSKTHHPDRFREGERRQAEKNYQLIVKAYNILKDPGQRKKYDSTLSQPVPTPAVNTQQQFDQFYRAGVSKYNQKQYELAVEFFTKAVFYKEHAEAFYLKGMAEFNVPAKRKNALQSLQKATEIDQFNPKYLKGFAKTLVKLNMNIRAKSVIQKALELSPDDLEVQELAAEIDPSLAPKKGLLGGLFGKFRGD